MSPWRPLIPPVPSVSLRRGRRGEADPSEEEVAEIHRLRLANGLIAAVAAHGYDAVSMRELYRRSKVDKRHFYGLYGSKFDCYMEVYAQITDALVGRLVEAWMGGEDDPALRLSAAVEAFVRSVAQEPAAARLALCAPSAIGGGALLAKRDLDIRLEEHLLAGLQAYEIVPASTVAQAMFTGVSAVVRTRVLEDRAAELPALAGEIGAWAWCCLAAPAPRERSDRAMQFGFRPSVRLLAKARVADEPVRERILAATLEQAASCGCNGLQERAIRERAKASRAELKEHFGNADGAFAAVLARLWTDAMRYAANAAARTPERPQATLVTIEALLSCLVADELFARLAITEMPTRSGIQGERDGLRLIAAVAAVLRRAVPQDLRPSEVAAQASAAAGWKLVRRSWDSGRRDGLLDLAPTLSHIVLAPTIATLDTPG